MSNRYGLPVRPFLYYLDQIADLLAVDDVKTYVHYDGRSTGKRPPDKMLAVNIAPAGTTPVWRVEESEMFRWFKATGIRPLTRTYY